jgi:hypothetical protein
VVPYIVGKLLIGLQLCFRFHLNRRFAHKVMGLQSRRNPDFGNFGTPIWESRGKMSFEYWPYGQAQSILWGGRWWFPPSLDCDESYEFVFAHGLSMHQKCFDYALTNLLFGLCKSLWIIELLVNLPSPHPRAPTRPSTFKVLWTREHALTLHSSDVFTLNLR